MAKKQKNDKEKKANNFFKDLKIELKKVTWPTFKGLVNNTSAVIAIVLIVAAIVFILDVCFENLNKVGVGKLKSLVSSDIEQVSENNDENSIDLTTDSVDVVSSDEENTEETVPAEGVEDANTQADTEVVE